jgi:hypothetical protein
MTITGLRQAAVGTINLNFKSKTSEGGWIVGAATLAYTCTDAHRVKANSLYSNIRVHMSLEEVKTSVNQNRCARRRLFL